MTVRPVYRGDAIVTAVEGGVVRKMAPEAGVVVELQDVDVFVAWSELVAIRAKVRGRK